MIQTQRNRLSIDWKSLSSKSSCLCTNTFWLPSTRRPLGSETRPRVNLVCRRWVSNPYQSGENESPSTARQPHDTHQGLYGGKLMGFLESLELVKDFLSSGESSSHENNCYSLSNVILMHLDTQITLLKASNSATWIKHVPWSTSQLLLQSLESLQNLSS